MSETTTNYFDKLHARCEAADTSLCVGLDPDPRRIPKTLGSGPEAVYKFCVEIIEATADSAAAFKPNLAFFESIGPDGWHVLEEALKVVPPEIPVILDAKRGDIGSTAQHYARALFDRLRGDAVTVNPYMGIDGIKPFLEHANKGVYVLCLTSNESAHDFELPEDLYLRVARKCNEWNDRRNIGLVVGATKPQYLQSIISVAPDLPMLIPGLGAQGGDLEELMEAAPGTSRRNMLFNVSRSILYAADDATFGRQARVAARYYCNRINQAREKTIGS